MINKKKILFYYTYSLSTIHSRNLSNFEDFEDILKKFIDINKQLYADKNYLKNNLLIEYKSSNNITNKLKNKIINNKYNTIVTNKISNISKNINDIDFILNKIKYIYIIKNKSQKLIFEEIYNLQTELDVKIVTGIIFKETNKWKLSIKKNKKHKEPNNNNNLHKIILIKDYIVYLQVNIRYNLIYNLLLNRYLNIDKIFLEYNKDIQKYYNDNSQKLIFEGIIIKNKYKNYYLYDFIKLTKLLDEIFNKFLNLKKIGFNKSINDYQNLYYEIRYINKSFNDLYYKSYLNS